MRATQQTETHDCIDQLISDIATIAPRPATVTDPDDGRLTLHDDENDIDVALPRPEAWLRGGWMSYDDSIRRTHVDGEVISREDDMMDTDPCRRSIEHYVRCASLTLRSVVRPDHDGPKVETDVGSYLYLDMDAVRADLHCVSYVSMVPAYWDVSDDNVTDWDGLCEGHRGGWDVWRAIQESDQTVPDDVETDVLQAILQAQ